MTTTVERTRAPLLQTEPRAQLPARAEREAILSRARALVASQSAAQVRAPPVAPKVEGPAPAALPAGQRVRLQMFCSGAGRSFIGIGLERNGLVQLVGRELPAAGNGTGNAPLARSYTYIGALREWNCPICRAAPAGVEAFGCDCACFSDVLHCGGRRGSGVYCACGAFSEPNFRLVPSLAVRGHASAHTPTKRLLLAGPRQPPQALLPRCLR
jgi:hypothetical protein